MKFRMGLADHDLAICDSEVRSKPELTREGCSWTHTCITHRRMNSYNMSNMANEDAHLREKTT